MLIWIKNDKNTIKRVKLVELNISIVTVFFEYANFKDNLIEYKCVCCNKNYQQKFDEKYILFILLLQKGVFPYEYIDDWEKINEASLIEKNDFYSHLLSGL